MKIDERYKEFINKLKQIKDENSKYSILTIFQDFLLLVTLAIKNQYDFNFNDGKMISSLSKKYKDEIEKFDELLEILRKIYINQNEIEDVLGHIIVELNINGLTDNEFITPIEVANVEAELCFCPDVEEINEIIRKNGIMTIRNNHCLTGAVILGCVNKLKPHIDNFSEKVIFLAYSKNLIHICTTFIQLTMNQVSAKVILTDQNGNIEKVIFTPEYYKNIYLKNKINDDI